MSEQPEVATKGATDAAGFAAARYIRARNMLWRALHLSRRSFASGRPLGAYNALLYAAASVIDHDVVDRTEENQGSLSAAARTPAPELAWFPWPAIAAAVLVDQDPEDPYVW